LSAIIGGKFILKKSLTGFALQSEFVISTNESTEFITGHVIHNPAYTYKFQLKTTLDIKKTIPTILYQPLKSGLVVFSISNFCINKISQTNELNKLSKKKYLLSSANLALIKEGFSKIIK
jgi:hypothetical protein